MSNEVQFKVRVIMSDKGVALVELQVSEIKLLLTPESAGELGLTMLSEAYNAKAAHEVWKYINEDNTIKEDN